MVTVRVIRRFRDLRAHVSRAEGDTFDATEERAAEIAERLPGYVETSAADADLSGMTVAQLRELAGERGLAVPKRATRQALLAMLGG